MKFIIIIKEVCNSIYSWGLPEFYLFDSPSELRKILVYISEKYPHDWNTIKAISISDIVSIKADEKTDLLAMGSQLFLYAKDTRLHSEVIKSSNITNLLILFVKFFIHKDRDVIMDEQNKLMLTKNIPFIERLQMMKMFFVWAIEKRVKQFKRWLAEDTGEFYKNYFRED